MRRYALVVPAACVALACGPRSDPSEQAKLALERQWTSAPLPGFTEASLSATDLNGDGTLDVVLGHGAVQRDGPDAPPATEGFATALDGVDGSVLWTTRLEAPVFSVATWLGVPTSDVPDLVIGGRGGSLQRLRGSDGAIVWRKREADPSGTWTWNFYTSQPLEDLNADGIVELLAAYGGNPDAAPFDATERPPGRLLVLDGATGTSLADVTVPDGAETYMSPLSYEHPTLGRSVVFGTGGETLAGRLWVVPLTALLRQDMHQARVLVEPVSAHGWIAPPALGDLTGDGVLDIVVQAHDARLLAIDGASFEQLWDVGATGMESNTAPALGFLNDDAVPDVLTRRVYGEFPAWSGSTTLAVDGRSGEVLWTVDEQDLAVGSAVVADLNHDDLDEVIYSSTSSLATTSTALETVVHLVDFSVDGGVATPLETLSGSGIGTYWLGSLASDSDTLTLLTAWSEAADEPAALRTYVACNRVTGSQIGPVSWGGYLGTRHDGVLGPTRPRQRAP